MTALVIPSNRPEHLRAFLDAWRPWPWDHIVIVEDNPTITFEPSDDDLAESARLDLFSWAEIDTAIRDASIISRRDSAIRAFGFWHAWHEGAEVIVTLDDDCYPTGEDLVAGHLANLCTTPRWTSTVPGMRVRGLPYDNLGTLADVAVSIGLWQGYPDLDGMETLTNGPQVTGSDWSAGIETRVISPEQLVPMSGMNLAVIRDIACLMYYPPMGEGSPYGRFDDIWCGLVVQRVCRHLRRSITVGHPIVNHQRASDPHVNAAKEAPGVAAHEKVWELVDEVALTATDPLGCMAEMGLALAAHATEDPYVGRWGEAILTWCDLFR